MWRTLLRWTLFLLAFNVTVSVRAASYFEPDNCEVGKDYPCAAFQKTSRGTLTWDEHQVRSLKGSSFKVEEKDSIRIMHGEVLVETQGQLQVKSLFGELRLTGARVLLSVTASAVKVRSLEGRVVYKVRGSDKDYYLPVGFYNTLKRVGVNGVANSEYPRPSEMRPLLRLWSQFFSRAEKDELVAQLQAYRQPWQKAVAGSEGFYVETVRRQVAALEAERERQRRDRLKILKEQNFYRDMFRRRNFLEE